MSGEGDKPKAGEGIGSSLVLVPKDTTKYKNQDLLPTTVKSSALALTGALPTASAEKGSVAVAGDNTAPIVNVQAAWGSTVSVNIERQIARELPSHLSNVVARFSDDLSEYNSGPMRTLPPEVLVKVSYNNLPQGHHLLTDYRKYGHILEASYRGVEQRNDDARRLVRRRAAVAYQAQLHTMCTTNGVALQEAHAYARNHAVTLVMSVIAVLVTDFNAGGPGQVLQETAHLAICLIVADAVIECEVLERPLDAVAS